MDRDEILTELNKAYFSDDMHEREILEALPEILKDVRHFVDVGASLGQYTLAALRCMSGGRITALEADPLRAEELKQNCQRWQAETACSLSAIHGAVADVAGTAEFFVTDTSVSGGLFPHPAPRDDIKWRKVQVEAFTLDGLFADDPPDLVKIDVEGSELRILQGAQRLLATHRSCFLIEVHSWGDLHRRSTPSDLGRFMLERGYAPVRFHGPQLFLPLGPRWAQLRLRQEVHRLPFLVKESLRGAGSWLRGIASRF